MLTALELQAAILLRLDRPAEAETVALQMAATSPYDVITQQRASPYVGLTAQMTPAKKEYLDRLARVSARGLINRANAEEWNGDFLAAASDLESFVLLAKYFETEKKPVGPMPAFEAKRAVDLSLGGDVAKSDAIAAETRKATDDMIQSGKALNMQQVIDEAEELLDLQSVAAMLQEGKAHQARTMFSARSRWVSPSAAVVAELTARLRKGAAPAELVGPLSRDPVVIRSSGLSARAGAIVGRTMRIRPFMAPCVLQCRATNTAPGTAESGIPATQAIW